MKIALERLSSISLEILSHFFYRSTLSVFLSRFFTDNSGGPHLRTADFKMFNVRNLAVFFGALLPGVLAAPAPITKKDDIIPGKFIVTLKPGIDAAAAETHLNWATDVHKRSFAKRDTAGIEKKFGIKDWKAYSGEFDEATIAEIKASPEVSSILDY